MIAFVWIVEGFVDERVCLLMKFRGCQGFKVMYGLVTCLFKDVLLG